MYGQVISLWYFVTAAQSRLSQRCGGLRLRGLQLGGVLLRMPPQLQQELFWSVPGLSSHLSADTAPRDWGLAGFILGQDNHVQGLALGHMQQSSSRPPGAAPEALLFWCSDPCPSAESRSKALCPIRSDFLDCWKRGLSAPSVTAQTAWAVSCSLSLGCSACSFDSPDEIQGPQEQLLVTTMAGVFAELCSS